MKKLQTNRDLIKHQDFRLRELTKDEIFDAREIESIEASLKDIEEKFSEANKELKKISIKKDDLDHQRIKKSITHYRKKYAENKKILKDKIHSYLKRIKA